MAIALLTIECILRRALTQRLYSELDNTTVYNYQNYATSEFQSISLLGALSTAGTIISAVMKPPIAKISDVVGRAETYCGAVLLYILSYILCASSKNFNQYAGGYIVYCIGQTGMQILNQLLVADITTARWRGLANSLVNIPFMVVPWIAAFIVDSALVTFGWRWGIGMFAIIMPVCALSLVVPLLLFQRRMKQLGCSTKCRMSFYNLVSQSDVVGMVLLSGGFAMLLLPLALAGGTPERWHTPWVPAVMVVGAVFLGLLLVYEGRFAAHPLIPLHFLRNISLMLAWIIGLLDAFAFSVTHTYMYAWVTVVHAYGARDATFLTYTAGCMQVLVGLFVGFFMYRTRSYKWILVIGVVVRLIGYGVMLRLRGAKNSTAELFVVQIIQGAGSGIVQTIVLVVAQIVVPRSELSQSTALQLLFIYLGNAIGSASAGAVYTSSFKERLRLYIPGASEESLDAVFNTIDEPAYAPGSTEDLAVSHAYSDVMRYMTFAALGASIFGVLLVWFLPDLRLTDKHNLAASLDGVGRDVDEEAKVGEGRAKSWWRTGRLW